MPKRDIPPNADEETRFAVVMEGLLNPDGSLKPPKDGSWYKREEGEPPQAEKKWENVGQKPGGDTLGFLVKKNRSFDKKQEPRDVIQEKYTRFWLCKITYDLNEGVLGRNFYSNLCEALGSELVRYVLGEAAPKNRLIKDTREKAQMPAIVSRFLPDFKSLAELGAGLSGPEKIKFNKQTPYLDGMCEALVATAFWNDYDGLKPGNIGMFRSASGKYKVGRVDFGTSFYSFLSQDPLSHAYGLGLFLFDEGRHSSRYRYAEIYAPLLTKKELRTCIENISNINIEHLGVIIRASVRRFADAWNDVPLNQKAIDKLFSHLFGENKELWYQHGYNSRATSSEVLSEAPLVWINYKEFVPKICDSIINAIEERKKVFAFFAKALEHREELRVMAHRYETDSTIESESIHAKALFQEALEDKDGSKFFLLTLMVKDITGYPLTPLEKDVAGVYPTPVSCSLLLYYINDEGKITWGCVESNRVGVVTLCPPAGTQDLIVVRGEERFVLEIDKPFPDLKYDFLKSFIGKPFNGDNYQQIISLFFEQKFSVYMESALATAIQEAGEEHGIKLGRNGRDTKLLISLTELPAVEVRAKRGPTKVLIWVAHIRSPEGIVLSKTSKVEQKIAANLNREFYEIGCWHTSEEVKHHFTQERLKYLSAIESESEDSSLILREFGAYEERTKLLEKIELQITSFSKNPGPLFSKGMEGSGPKLRKVGLYSFFGDRPDFLHEEVLTDVESPAHD